MKHFCLFSLFLINIGPAAGQRTWYVRPDAPAGRDGGSWQTAAALHDALTQARPGDQIWVLHGTYTPTPTADASISFHLPDGVRLYGGFAGHELAPGERAFVQAPADSLPNYSLSTLSGRIGGGKYANHVVQGVNVTGSVLDGFCIEDGRVSVPRQPGAPVDDGGGVNLRAQGRDSVLELRIERCIFRRNHAVDDGGGLYLEALRGGVGLLHVRCCLFEENTAPEGGAAATLPRKGRIDLSFEACVFRENTAFCSDGGDDGGAFLFYCDKNQNQLNRLAFAGCQFKHNRSEEFGGAIAVVSDLGAQLLFTLGDCTFTGNTAIYGGGALWTHNLEQLECLVSDCRFEGNSATGFGGAWLNLGKPARTEITRTQFTGNYVEPRPAEAGTSCIFGPTHALVWQSLLQAGEQLDIALPGDGGGGVAWLAALNSAQRPALVFTDCLFQDNRAPAAGGALIACTWERDSLPLRLSRCHFEGNTAASGELLFVQGAGLNAQLLSCTLERQTVSNLFAGQPERVFSDQQAENESKNALPAKTRTTKTGVRIVLPDRKN